MFPPGSCNGYTNITEPWRNLDFLSTSFPGYPNNDQKLVNSWWRFTGIGGDRVTGKCVGIQRGGALRPIYLASTYPTSESLTPKRGSSYGWHGGCRGVTVPVDVVLCPGGFYVHKPLSYGSSLDIGYTTCE